MLALNSVIDDGRFQLVGTVGKGATAITYLGYDSRSTTTKPKHYAVKCLSRVKNDGAVLKREIRLHKLVCAHPGIVTIRRSLVEGPFQLLIMDYCADGDLFYQITQCYRYFGEDDLIRDVYLQIVDAVGYCHSLGVFHRDLKPENILCRAGGTKVVLADFGLATLDIVSTDLRVGSAYYISPECNSGPLYSTAGNDVWSLGVILMNLAYGRNPWARAELSDETFREFVNDPEYLTSILPIPAPVQAVFRGLLDLDPSRRISLAGLHRAISGVERFMLNPRELPEVKLEARNVAVGILETMAARQQMKNADPSVPKAHSTVALEPRSSLHAPPLEPPSPHPFAIPPIAQSSQRIRRSLPHLMFRRVTSFRDSAGSDSSSSSSPLTPQSVEPDYFPSPPPISRQARMSAEVIVPGQSNISRSREAFAHGVYGSIDEKDEGEEGLLGGGFGTYERPPLMMPYNINDKGASTSSDPFFSDPRSRVPFLQ